jgi:hypothetical protein
MPAATTTLSNIMGVVVNTTIDFATEIFTTYWPYVLVVGAVVGLVVLFKRLALVGAKGS